MCVHCSDSPAGSRPAARSGGAMGWAGRFCLLLIAGYRCLVSPLFPPCCRYTPTCSEYAIEAVSRYGALRGMWMAFCRILRCHPFVRGGYDPVK